MKSMLSVDEAAAVIRKNEPLLIGGDEKLLAKLPKGKWIGGTIPYFMSERGGVITRELVQVVSFPREATLGAIKVYREVDLASIPQHYSANGFSMVLIPGLSAVHQAFAEKSFQYPNVFDSPLVGWITGFHLDDLGSAKAKVWNGVTGEHYDNAVVVMHMSLPDKLMARANIINLFEQSKGDVITFDTVGFSAVSASVNGKRVGLAPYIKEKKLDTRLPLVANYQGAMINVSFQSVDEKSGKVSFYAPVFPGVEYRLAKALPDYGVEFVRELEKRKASPMWSCNCILNFLYAGLEGKKTAEVTGPITFGEVAYILLNQTMVYLTLEAKS